MSVSPRTSVFRQTARAQVANTATETALFGTAVGSAVLQGGALRVGSVIRVLLLGILSTKATPGTLTIRFKVNGTTVATCTGTPPDSLTNRSADMAFVLTLRTLGATGTAFPWAAFGFNSGDAATERWAANTNATVTVDTTGTFTLSVTAQWQTADTSNDLRVDVAEIDVVQ